MCHALLAPTQFCTFFKTVLFCTAYYTLPKHHRDGLGCKDCCTNTNILTYLLIRAVAQLFGGTSIYSLANHERLQREQTATRDSKNADRLQTVHTLCWGVIASTRPTKIRWDTSSSQAYANPGAFAGRSMCNTLLQTQIQTLPVVYNILVQRQIWR